MNCPEKVTCCRRTSQFPCSTVWTWVAPVAFELFSTTKLTRHRFLSTEWLLTTVLAFGSLQWSLHGAFENINRKRWSWLVIELLTDARGSSVCPWSLRPSISLMTSKVIGACPLWDAFVQAQSRYFHNYHAAMQCKGRRASTVLESPWPAIQLVINRSQGFEIANVIAFLHPTVQGNWGKTTSL